MPSMSQKKRTRRIFSEHWVSSLIGLGTGLILTGAVIAGTWYQSGLRTQPSATPKQETTPPRPLEKPQAESILVGSAKPSAPVRHISMKEIAAMQVEQVRRPLSEVFREKPEGGLASRNENLPLSSTQVKEAMSVLEGYRRAGSLERKADYVLNKDAVLPKMQKHYQERQGTDPVTTRLISATQILFSSSSFLSLTFESPSHSDQQAVAIFVRSVGAGLLLDWESWTGFNDMDWPTLQKEKPQTPVWMRVTAVPGDYYNHEFADKAHYLCVKLISPDGGHSMYGYVRRSTTVAKLFADQLRYEEFEITGRAKALMRLTVRITFPPAAKSDQCVNIRQVLPNRWFMFDWEAADGL